MLRSSVSLLRARVWLELEEQHLIFLFSVWNLVTIALERYLAVCQPFKYANFMKSKVVLIFIWMYIMSIICSGGGSFQVTISSFFKIMIHFLHVTCVREILLEGVGRQEALPSRNHKSGRCASYWNAFFFHTSLLTSLFHV